MNELRKGKRSYAERTAAVQNLASLLGRFPADEAFKRAAAHAQCTETTMRQWHSDAARSDLYDPDAELATGKKARRQYSDEFKAKALEAYQAQRHLHVDQIAQELGIATHLLSAWAGKAKVGRKAMRGGAAPGHALAKANGEAIRVAPPPTAELSELMSRNRELEGKLSRAKEFMHHLVEAAF